MQQNLPFILEMLFHEIVEVFAYFCALHSRKVVAPNVKIFFSPAEKGLAFPSIFFFCENMAARMPIIPRNRGR